MVVLGEQTLKAIWQVVRKNCGRLITVREVGRRPRGLNWCSACPEGTGRSQEPIRKVEWTGPGDRWMWGMREWQELINDSELVSLGSWVVDDVKN